MPNTVIRQPLTGDATGDIGMLTHLTIDSLLPQLDTLHTRAAVANLAMATARGMLGTRNAVTRSAIATQAAGLATKYLLDLVPDRPWTLLGIEMRVGNRIADVVWEHPDSSILIDEIKGGRSRAMLNRDWTEQVAELNLGGIARWGSRFRGVRLLPLSCMQMATLVSGPLVRLIDPTPANPLAVREVRA